jgi:hypothetical protein
MRSIDDQQAFLSELLAIWAKHSELRFAQFIGNACAASFFDSDKEVLARIRRFYAEQEKPKPVRYDDDRREDIEDRV